MITFSTYVWDSEAYVDLGNDTPLCGIFIPYACGYKKIGVQDVEGECSTLFPCYPVHITEREGITSPIYKMMEKIFYEDENNVIYMYAHNAKKFDNYLLLNDQCDDTSILQIKFFKVVKSASGLVKVVVHVSERTNADNKKKFIYQCTLAHIPGTLAQLAKNYKDSTQDDTVMKGEIDHDLITASTWKDLKNDWLPYLIKDVDSLANVWTKYTHSMCGDVTSLVYPLLIHKYLSSPSLAWNYLLYTLGDDCSSTFKYFTDKSVRAFV